MKKSSAKVHCSEYNNMTTGGARLQACNADSIFHGPKSALADGTAFTSVAKAATYPQHR
jgi:hypothetical protein